MLKRAVFTLLLLLTGLAAPAQQYNWVRSFGGPYYTEFGMDVHADAAGNVYVCGNYEPGAYFGPDTAVVYGLQDAFVTKLDPGGNLVWTWTYGGADADRFFKVDVDAAGYVYVSGEGKVNWPLKQAELHARDACIARISPNGNLVYAHNLNGDTYSEGRDVSAGPAGTAILVGMHRTQTWFDTDTLLGYGVRDGFVVAWDSVGNVLWKHTLGGAGSDYAYAVDHAPDGSIYVGGEFSGEGYFVGDTLQGGALSGYVLKLDGNGNRLWSRRFYSPVLAKVYALAAGPSGSVYCTGIFRDSLYLGDTVLYNAGLEDVFYCKMSPAGDVLWARQAGGTNYQDVQDIEVGPGETVLIGGFMLGQMTWDQTTVSPGAFDNLYFARVDSAGNTLEFQPSLYPSTRDIFGVGMDPAGNCLLSGFYTDSITLGPHRIEAYQRTGDIFVAKYGMPASLTLDSLWGSPYCAGDLFYLAYTVAGAFDNGNAFEVQLSDAAGSFAAPVVIGSVNGYMSGVVQAQVPTGIPAGTGYRVRIHATQPSLVTNDNGTDLSLSIVTATPVTLTGDTVICAGDTVTLTANAGFASYLWSTGDTTESIQITQPGTYTVSVTEAAGCSNEASWFVDACISRGDVLRSHLSLSPNPSTGAFCLRGLPPDCRSLRLYDRTGRLVAAWEPAGAQEFAVQLPPLPAGIYTVQVITPDALLSLPLSLQP